ncbi:MAG: RpiB/LacA/LacB family sugar-phosphate isomerase [Planctomycetaceae bacterium]|nr:RpiB/LacA/LacB family sugar-phosphate isomerase [Planctomycetaceae bacterium]
MNIIIASDYRGTAVQKRILEHFRAAPAGMPAHTIHEVRQFDEDTDYPDIAAYVAKAVTDGTFERGILICGTGIGMCVAANKFPGVRAAPCHNEVVAELSRKHNDSNILCLSGDLLGDRAVIAVVNVWLETPFEGGRHSNRVGKIRQIEFANYTAEQI